MANIKCAACGFEEGEQKFIPIQLGNTSVSLRKSKGLNSLSSELIPANLIMCPDCKTVRIR